MDATRDLSESHRSLLEAVKRIESKLAAWKRDKVIRDGLADLEIDALRGAIREGEAV